MHQESEHAQNLPPLNHGIETAGALPPLNHNIESTSSLPPLNHATEEAASLPPLLHGIEQAENLPPLNHGNDALQSFHSLPPLIHGKEQAANLPPLFHGIEAKKLPPLNHANEQAGILPPLFHGAEQAQGVPSLSDFEKDSSPTLDALSAFTSQANNAFDDNGKQTIEHKPLDLNGVGKDYIEIPEDLTHARNPNAAVADGDKKSSFNDRSNSLSNLNQGKAIDQQSFVRKDERVEVSDPLQDSSLPDSEKSTQTKASGPTAYDDEEELQKLMTADQISQGVTTSSAAAKFGNQAPPGII